MKAEFRVEPRGCAPLRIPLRRRLQTAAILLAGAIFPICTCLFILSLFWPWNGLSPRKPVPSISSSSSSSSSSLSFFPLDFGWIYALRFVYYYPLYATSFLQYYLLHFRILLIAYVSWMLLFDFKTPVRGGRDVHRIRGSRVWKYISDYFPSQLYIVPSNGYSCSSILANRGNNSSSDHAPTTTTAPPTATATTPRTEYSSLPRSNTNTTTTTTSLAAVPASLSPLSLPPSPEFRPHIFACHPHGIISIATIVNLASSLHADKLKLSPPPPQYYKGIMMNASSSSSTEFPLRILTVSANFLIPFWRDLLLAMGFVSASRESASYCLSHGLSIAIVVGGALESLDARPKKADLTLAKRKGFIRLALQHGCNVVPVYHFGENELFDQLENPQGSLIRRVQLFLIRILGFTLPIFYGRGIFQYEFGILPHRIPLKTVCGEALRLPQISFPSQEVVNEWHARYIEALRKLYVEHAEDYYRDLEGLVVKKKRNENGGVMRKERRKSGGEKKKEGEEKKEMKMVMKRHLNNVTESDDGKVKQETEEEVEKKEEEKEEEEPINQVLSTSSSTSSLPLPLSSSPSPADEVSFSSSSSCAVTSSSSSSSVHPPLRIVG